MAQEVPFPPPGPLLPVHGRSTDCDMERAHFRLPQVSRGLSPDNSILGAHARCGTSVGP